MFDSDAAHNDTVLRAEGELAELLRGQGATVSVVRRPGRPDVRKVGLDDYLLAHSAADLRRLLGPPPPPPPPKQTLADVTAAFRRWLHLPDAAPLELALAAVVANRSAGNPVWLLLVGPPGSGKTEIVEAVAAACPDVHTLGTLTEAALLSGSSRKDYTAGSTGGLFRKMGGFGILALKDFGSILPMNKDSRAAVLAAPREVYDGRWVRHVGADGGKELAWSGKCGLIGGSTPAVDQHYALIAALGERFVYLRKPSDGRRDRGRRAIRSGAEAPRMRKELAAAVAGLLQNTPAPDRPPDLPDDDLGPLVCLADLTAVCRTAVPRSLNGREIIDVPLPEECTRLGIVFRLLRDAFPALGIGAVRGWDLLTRLALDSIPVVGATSCPSWPDHGTRSGPPTSPAGWDCRPPPSGERGRAAPDRPDGAAPDAALELAGSGGTPAAPAGASIHRGYRTPTPWTGPLVWSNVTSGCTCRRCTRSRGCAAGRRWWCAGPARSTSGNSRSISPAERLMALARDQPAGELCTSTLPS